MLLVAALLLWLQLGGSASEPVSSNSSIAATTPEALPPGDQEVCQIWKNMTQQEICDYINYNDDICEGGGYLLWSQYVECQFNTGKKVTVIIAGVLWMFMLFVMVSSTADDFFSPSVSSIVAHLKISESIAGVTFMAFGNGAPDIFGSIASVLSSPKPKAGLALGELFGAGTFVTTVVTATIILVKPFKIDIFSTLRDILFYLVAIGWILFVFLHSDQVYIWEPAGFLGLYLIYLLTVIVGHHLHRRKRKQQKRENSMKNKLNGITSRQGSIFPVIPEVHIISDAVEKIQESPNGDLPAVTARKEMMKRASIAINGDILNVFPVTAQAMASTILEYDENQSDGEETSEEEFVVSHNHVYVGHEVRSRAATLVPPPIKVVTWQTCLLDVYKHLHPLPSDWDEQGRFSKVLSVIKIPAMFFFKLTIPLNETSWSKTVAIIQAIFAPQWFLFAIQLSLWQPFDGSPGLYAYALPLSAVVIALLWFFTSFETQPRYYTEVSSYVGFLMSISWIYFISSEIVNVVTMLGVISQISHEVLGLTILAWSNSIGDLIADISVVKQGYPRMAMAAAIGGPLFNLLMGFGIPFLIAKANGRIVTIEFNATYKVLILFLAISLVTTLVACFVQRFYLRRPHAIVLILIYLAFITTIILIETQVIVWN
ncbi:hypothetical protein Q1695_014632 [Nippostrongylus brasiliensis]|nr:hypothetical protein Q1695_014632 [Nippostrongylus brasiliensis]